MKKGQGSGKHGQTTFAIERFRYINVFFSPHILLLLTRRPSYKALCYIEVLLYMDFEHLEFALLLTCILFSLGRTILSIVFQNICY